jgi:hypothetical protein
MMPWGYDLQASYAHLAKLAWLQASKLAKQAGKLYKSAREQVDAIFGDMNYALAHGRPHGRLPLGNEDV